MNESLITPDLRARIGVPTPPVAVTLTVEHVRRLREMLAGGPLPRGADNPDTPPPAVLLLGERDHGVTLPPALTESSLVTGGEWEWRRPLRVGETLTAVERLLDANERAGGRLGHALFLRYEWTLTGADGEPAAYSRRSIAFYTGAGRAPAEAVPAGLDLLPPPAELPPGVAAVAAGEGDELPPRRLTPTLGQVVRFCGASGSYVPIFYDPEAARAAGLPGTIIPGPLKLALLADYVQAWAGPAAFLVSIRAAYRRPDQPGRPLLFGGTVSRVTSTPEGRRLECELWARQATGDRSVAGAAVVRLPV